MSEQQFQDQGSLNQPEQEVDVPVPTESKTAPAGGDSA
jgi:hypothetical protein